MKTAFIIDSCSSISQELRERPDVFVVDLEVTWGDGIRYTDSTDTAVNQEFYQRLKSTKDLPKTSQPNPAQIIMVFDEIVAEGFDEVIIITIAQVLSGTYQTVAALSQEYADRLTIRLIDSKGVSYIEAHLLKWAIRLSEAGKSLDFIEKSILWLADETHIYVLIEDLNNIVKGGRLSRMEAVVGGALRIKPILHFDDEGRVVTFEKLRTTKRVYDRYVELAKEAYQRFEGKLDLVLAHGDSLVEAEKVKAMLNEALPTIKVSIGYLTPVIGTYGGKGALGLGILPWLTEESINP